MSTSGGDGAQTPGVPGTSSVKFPRKNSTLMAHSPPNAAPTVVVDSTLVETQSVLENSNKDSSLANTSITEEHLLLQGEKDTDTNKMDTDGTPLRITSNNNSLKRSRISDSPEDAADQRQNFIEEAVQRMEEAFATLDGPSSKLSKLNTDIVKRCIKQLVSIVQDCSQKTLEAETRLMERGEIGGRIEQLISETMRARQEDREYFEECMRRREREEEARFKSILGDRPPCQTSTNRAPSFASVAASRTSRTSQAPVSTFFISGTEEGGDKKLDSKSIRERIMGSIDPRQEGLKISNMRQAGEGRVAIEADDWITVDKLRKSKKFADSGLKMVEATKLNPKIIVYDVDRELDENRLCEALWAQNCNEECTLIDFKRDFKPKFRTGPRDGPRTHWVAEVAPALNRRILNKGRVYISFFSSKVEEYIGLSRCFRCQEFGHVAKYCRGDEVCKHCGRAGHRIEACDKSSAPVCAPCKTRKLKHSHVVGSSDCVARARALEALTKKIDYGRE